MTAQSRRRAGEYLRYYAALLAMPLFFLALFGSLFVVWEIFNLPPSEAILGIAEGWFDQFGLIALFFSALIEGMLLVGGYFPGVFVIFVGIILAETALEAVVAVGVVTVGLFIAHLFNYALGRYGWYKLLVRFGLRRAIEKAQTRLVTKGPFAILTSYGIPSIAALTDTAAGIIHMPFRTFCMYSLISVVSWDIVIGVFVYTFSDTALAVASPGASGGVFIVSVLVAWASVLIGIDFYKRRRPVPAMPNDSSVDQGKV